MHTLEEKLGYVFRNKALLENALQHSSYANEHRSAGLHSNERLEFLGDAVLGVVTADCLYRKHPGPAGGGSHPHSCGAGMRGEPARGGAEPGAGAAPEAGARRGAGRRP